MERQVLFSSHITRTEYDSRKEWLKGRRRIGGSGAAAILGLNPYMTNQDYYYQLTGELVPEDISDKPYVQYGISAEDHLRELFALDHPQYRVHYAENNLWVNDRFPFAHASLDGWLEDPDGRYGVLEIKTTNILQSMSKEKWKDRIPDNYYIQVLHYLMVTEFDFAVLKAQLKYDFGGNVYLETRHYTMERTEVAEDIEYLTKAEKDFWRHVERRKKPDLVLPDI